MKSFAGALGLHDRDIQETRENSDGWAQIGKRSLIRPSTSACCGILVFATAHVAMHHHPVVLVLVLLGVSQVLAFNCPGSTPNVQAPITTPPTFLKSTANGKLYMANTVSPPIRVLHVWGTAYERGFAAGQLLKDDLAVFLPSVLDYVDHRLESVIMQYLPFMPTWLVNYVAVHGIKDALDLTANLTAPYTPQHYTDEIRGMADGSGVSLKLITRLNMIPELIKAACSMVGAWGPAIAFTGPNNTLFQLRALDWDTSGPFANYPLVSIHHPNAGDGVPFATWGWTGFVGAITGYSSSNVGICEKWWATYNGTYFMEGYPFPYLLRDILQYDPDVSAAYNRIIHAQRTCSIWLGLGDSDMNQMRVVQYSHDIVNMFSDVSYPSYPNHPLFKGLTYVDRYEQPSHSPCLSELLKYVIFYHASCSVSSHASNTSTQCFCFAFLPRIQTGLSMAISMPPHSSASLLCFKLVMRMQPSTIMLETTCMWSPRAALQIRLSSLPTIVPSSALT